MPSAIGLFRPFRALIQKTQSNPVSFVKDIPFKKIMHTFAKDSFTRTPRPLANSALEKSTKSGLSGMTNKLNHGLHATSPSVSVRPVIETGPVGLGKATLGSSSRFISGSTAQASTLPRNLPLKGETPWPLYKAPGTGTGKTNRLFADAEAYGLNPKQTADYVLWNKGYKTLRSDGRFRWSPGVSAEQRQAVSTAIKNDVRIRQQTVQKSLPQSRQGSPAANRASFKSSSPLRSTPSPQSQATSLLPKSPTWGGQSGMPRSQSMPSMPSLSQKWESANKAFDLPYNSPTRGGQ